MYDVEIDMLYYTIFSIYVLGIANRDCVYSFVQYLNIDNAHIEYK